MPESTIVVAPVATPATATPAIVAAPALAPVAIAVPSPLTQADFDKYAADAVMRNLDPAESAAPAPVAAETGQESPPAEVAPPAETSPTADTEDETEPSAEAQAAWSEGERRIHAALVKERTNRKAAREENASLKERLAALEAKINTPAEPAPSPSEPAPPASSPTPSVPGSLAACRTFDQVDASVMQAVNHKALATELIMNLSSGEVEPVREALKAQGVTRIGHTPIDDATPQEVGRLLVSVQSGCERTIHQAPARKAELGAEAVSFVEAGKILPGLTTKNSEAQKMFINFVNTTPNVRNLGPNWPELVAEGCANRLARAKATATNGHANGNGAANGNGVIHQSTNPPFPAPRSAPSAPRTSAAVVPRKSEKDEIVSRIHAGTASMKDMDRYAVLSLSMA